MGIVYERWYYRDTGPRQLSEIVAHLPGTKAELKRVAEKVAARAESNLMVRSRNRTGESRFRIIGPPVTDLDQVVVFEDNGKKGSAAAIEFGWQKHKGKSSLPGEVKGKGALTDAANEVVRGGL